jgi:hypothetical protein
MGMSSPRRRPLSVMRAAGGERTAQYGSWIGCAFQRLAYDDGQVAIAGDAGLVPPGPFVPVPYVSGPGQQSFAPQDRHHRRVGRVVATAGALVEAIEGGTDG